MDTFITEESRSRKTINLIWASVGFGALYWVIESLRDVIVFEKGTITERIFTPDPITFWMRILVVFIVILFGVYTETLKERMKTQKNRKTGEIKKTEIIWVGIGFGIMYWVIESIREALLHPSGDFIRQMLSPKPMELWARILAVCFLLLFSIYVQNLLNERRRIEKALRNANKKLKEFDQLKSDFLNTVSHELRTPIATMREGVRLCMDERVGTLNQVQKKLLTDTKNSIDRLNRLVTDLLDISKIEEGKLKLRRSSVDLRKIVEKVHENYIPQSQEKNIMLETHLPEKPLILFVDQDKVTQIFDNLLNNAFRYTKPGGKITIEVIDKGNFAECSVADTGIGIAKENLPLLFSKFVQIGRVNGPGYKGTGLGLAICKGLVEKHGGKIWVESQLGKGTTFRFTLKNVPFPKILIVDDEKNVVEIIKGFLSLDNYRLIEAYDGSAAVEKAVDEQPSLVILDMNLPAMNGYEVIGRLKQDIRTRDIPIIIASAFSVDTKRLERINDHAAIPIIGKPIEPEKLRNNVTELLLYGD